MPRLLAYFLVLKVARPRVRSEDVAGVVDRDSCAPCAHGVGPVSSVPSGRRHVGDVPHVGHLIFDNSDQPSSPRAGAAHVPVPARSELPGGNLPGAREFCRV